MKKSMSICFALVAAVIYLQCNNNPSENVISAKANSAKAVDGPCLGDDLFPIVRPSNAQPDSGKECQFYKWAWQTFLYVTQIDSVNNLAMFLKFETPSSLFGDSATPLFKNVRNSKILLLAPRLTEDSIVTGFSDVMQAVSKDVLVDKNGRTIYYAQHLNDTFFNFVRDSGYTNMSRLLAADPKQTFPRGSLELKSSWKVVMPGDDTGSFYTTWANIAQFETKTDSNGKTIVVINPSNTKKARVALLGLHVVGIVAGHPEFIWATFEHDSLAPNNPNRDGTIDNRPLDSNNNHHWHFYNTGQTGQNCNKGTLIKDLIFQNEAQQRFKNISSVFHQYWFDDDDNIQPLDSSVRKLLSAKSSIWANYTFKGAVWLNDPLHKLKLDNSFTPDELKDTMLFGGEQQLSNVTMETFTQPVQRCFSCHQTRAEKLKIGDSLYVFPAKIMGMSHVLTNAYFNSQSIAVARKRRQQSHQR